MRVGEGWSAVLLAVTVFLLLFASYLLKTVREAFSLTEGGAYIKAYSSAGETVLLMFCEFSESVARLISCRK